MTKHMWLTAVVYVIASTTTSFAQSQQSPPLDGLALLKRVAQHYADAKSYHIEFVRERTDQRELRRDWEKTILSATESPGGHYRYEGRAGLGGAIKIADGKTVWTYHIDEHRYTAKSIAPETSGKPISMSEIALTEAQGLRRNLSDLAGPYKSATLLPDSTLTVNGQPVPCHIVRVQASDQKRQDPGLSGEKTLWIDKARETLLKVSEHGKINRADFSPVPVEVDVTAFYTFTQLDRELPDGVFTFTPPPDASLVDDFPDPFQPGKGILRGQVAPAIKLKSPDGKIVSLDSFRGKPVLLDVWATWCAPCVTGLAQLAKIHDETNGKELVLITIDQDEEEKTATDFLTKKGYSWPNFHDDGELGKSLGPSAIPRSILIDRQGKVTFDGMATTDDQLRTEIAKLGPEYASLAPKLQQPPCSISK